MSHKRKMWIFLLGFLCVSAAYASIPASTTYVDEQIAIMRAEILQLLINN